MFRKKMQKVFIVKIVCTCRPIRFYFHPFYPSHCYGTAWDRW